MNNILEVKNLKKYFDVSSGTLHAVDGVSFSVKKGETIGVVGESGCGKSTLGRVLIHLIDNTDGQIVFNGKDITKIDRKELSNLRKDMQMIFQDPYSSLNPRFTVYQTIAEPLQIAGGFSQQEISERVYKMMDTVGLARRLVNSYPHELDGGRRQRIGIGRALILEPSFIVCDEPVSALDVSIQAQIINLLLDIQEEKKLTYIFITHDLMVVKYISNNIMVMYLGQMVEFSPSEELFEQPLHPYTKALLSAVPVPDVEHEKKRIVLKGEVTSPINPKPCCRFSARCAYAKDICHCKSPELIEVNPKHKVACHFAKEINGLE
ncbi:peptide/nickel transport system ATP-binding protein [Ruminiclostridium sufflavum DSM 19573]|uniref:Peptide/nickel transport system ATP-binding protein n=1 Tax=Ruminiclostridium sufflavum DSM 19573 TaxID=1121337 RepID=A0A318XTT5_9FIRM|nr:oligopeptide/dipeptide ABC transporter ATP-binding protein [Ruminiclostridium sufflavum]PYG90263.1 peptide/nickel transport system ATP-binding protein [Ruminiclostridium sufflavum DSM 19573]